jgi:hypothetical protein
MMMRTVYSMFLVASLAACHGHDDAKPAAKAGKAKLEHASQTDLARELDDADRRGTWSDVRYRWQGQDLEWTVTRYRALCGSETRCNVAAFPVMRPAQRGWLPGIQFAPGEYAKLDAACGAAERCEITIDGTLSKLDVSGEMPTSVQLSNVKIKSAKQTT